MLVYQRVSYISLHWKDVGLTFHVSRFLFGEKTQREKVWFRPATCDLWSRLLATDHHFPSQFDISSDDGRALWTAADGDARQKPWRNLDPQRGEVKGWHSAVGLLKCSWWKWGMYWSHIIRSCFFSGNFGLSFMSESFIARQWQWTVLQRKVFPFESKLYCLSSPANLTSEHDKIVECLPVRRSFGCWFAIWRAQLNKLVYTYRSLSQNFILLD